MLTYPRQWFFIVKTRVFCRNYIHYEHNYMSYEHNFICYERNHICYDCSNIMFLRQKQPVFTHKQPRNIHQTNHPISNAMIINQLRKPSQNRVFSTHGKVDAKYRLEMSHKMSFFKTITIL